MSEPLNDDMKKKLFELYLKEVSAGVLVNCAYCNSPDIEFDNQEEHAIDDRRVYMSDYTCKRCGATCKNRQEWTREPAPESQTSTPSKSLNGTLWRCTEEDMDEYGKIVTVKDGEVHPDYNGENDIEIEYEDGTISYMKYRRFCMRFKRIL